MTKHFNSNTKGWLTSMKYYFMGLMSLKELRKKHPLDSPFAAGVHRACNDIERELDFMRGEKK